MISFTIITHIIPLILSETPCACRRLVLQVSLREHDLVSLGIDGELAGQGSLCSKKRHAADQQRKNQKQVFGVSHNTIYSNLRTKVLHFFDICKFYLHIPIFCCNFAAQNV